MKKTIWSDQKNKLSNLFNNDQEIKLKITWRMYFYVVYLCVVMFLVMNAIIGHYRNKPFAGIVSFLFIMSYLFSIFLVRRKED